MLKHALLGVAAAGLLASPALAGPMDAAFGNTVTVTAADGTANNLFFNEDGTYTTSAGTGGTWTLDGNTLCVTPEGGEPNCDEAADRAVGDTWEVTNADGSTATVSIVAGR